jgi:signal transduction histidine kinase
VELSAWRPALPLTFVLVSLGALLLVPLAVQQRREVLRAERDEVIEPARALVADVESAIARSVAARRGFLLTGDRAFMAGYRDALASERSARADLEPLTRRLGAEMARAFDSLAAVAEAWHGAEDDLTGGRAGPGVAGGVPEQQELYEATVAATDRLREAVVAVALAQRARIAGVERLGALASGGLLLVALGSAALLGWVAHRIQTLARIEQDLRLLSNRLTATVRVEETARLVTAAARAMTGAQGAFLGLMRPDAESMHVLTATGLASELEAGGGTTYQRPAALADDDGDPRSLSLDDLDARLRSPIQDRCAGCRAAVARLPLQEDSSGELVLLRRRRRFRAADLRRLSLLQDLACLALRKALLFEEAQRRRREAEELLNVRARLIRGISHDLKNPLGAADGYAELLETGVGGELTDKQRIWIARLRRAGRSMGEIIDDLVELSLSEGTGLPLRVEEVDIGRLATEAAEDYMAAATAAGLDLEVRVAPALPSIATDRRRVKEVLGNLLSNAVKYTPSGGRVTVRVEATSPLAAPSGVTIEVGDTGPGIPEAEQERVFKEFSRLDPGRASGSGIGLSMSRKVARLLGGELRLESHMGRGSTFTLVLPRRGGASAPRSTRDRPRRTVRRGTVNGG